MMRYFRWIQWFVGYGAVLWVWVLGSAADSSGVGKRWFRITGGLEATSEVVMRSDHSSYSLQPLNYHAERLMLNATVVLFDQIYLPFHLYLGNGQVSYDQPFNQFGASLRLAKWLTLHGGFFSFSFSPLTFGDLRLEGGGIELSPLNFRIAVFYGRGRRARLPDINRYFFGTYARWYWGVQMGYDNRSGGKVLLTLMKAYDDSTTLPCGTGFCPQPQENFVTSLNVAIPVRRIVRWSSEVAISAYSRDTRMPSVFDSFPYPWIEWFFVPRTSSAVDMAFQNRLTITPHPVWTLGVSADWVGPGYATLGYVHLIGDVMRLTFSPSGILQRGKMSVSGSVGIERDNVLRTRQQTSRRLIGSFSGVYMVTPQLSMSANYSNYGIQSYVVADSPRTRIITQNFAFSPQLQSSFWGLIHSTLLSYSFSDMMDHNLISGARSSFRGHSIQLTHTMRPGSSWSVTTSAYWIRNVSLPGNPTTLIGINQYFGMPLLEQKMRLSLRAGLSRQLGLLGRAYTANGSFSASYNFDKWGRLSMRTAYRHTWNDNGRRISDFRAELSYSIFFK